ncbi:hypothetical protein EUX98_g1204 [Antrodiella citrinella]|uniref:Uncharacterized protein n=1 Tax=Antrodiella citrinella TaxID=2447956 RepID=A0A4S4N544_9APHY|nr:hypothetical protein EUX98_g1204 [Antrodiella citrinella]
MSHSILASFDPLATHPFTNNSGLMPKPTPPSQYPLPIPSSQQRQKTAPSAPSKQHTLPMHAPQPMSQRSSPMKNGSRAPIFVPFRPERSSPELDDILLKKKVSDAFSNKQTWSIDQARLPHSSNKASSK